MDETHIRLGKTPTHKATAGNLGKFWMLNLPFNRAGQSLEKSIVDVKIDCANIG